MNTSPAQAWRNPAEVLALWDGATRPPPALMRYRIRGSLVELLANRGITLLLTREYEHLVLAVSATGGSPRISYLRVPHPSGLAVDRRRGVVYLASTRNPNQVVELAPIGGLLRRADGPVSEHSGRPLVPMRSWFLPGCLYLHDLAFIGGRLHGNAVGHNAVVSLGPDGEYRHVWWPRCVERHSTPVFDRNLVQLNSIAAGPDLDRSYFTASSDRVSARRPGHRNYPVDRRGVLFSGRSREAVVRGLTRPHSARLHRDRVWLDDSGYGRFGFGSDGVLEEVARLPGWTRGLCFEGDVAFVGTSRVLPRFRHYAPGLSEDSCVCGVHAVDLRSGKIMGSLTWPGGDQIFAVEWIPTALTSGFPFSTSFPGTRRVRELFYAFRR